MIKISHHNLAFLAIALLFVVIWLLNIPIAITLWRHGFDDGTYSHSYLIPFIMLYLYYSLAKVGMINFAKNVEYLKVMLLVLSCILLFLSSTAQISTGYWLSILLVCMASINLLFRFNWYIVFPATLLVFIFPIWGALVPLLQDISTEAVTVIMGFSGIPIYVEDRFITIPAGVFEIAGGCSGLRYLIVSLAISSLFIFLNIKSVKRASLFLGVAIAGALITNWIRISALIIIGDYTNMQSSLMTDHNAFGWYLYMPFMLMLFIWGNKIANFDLIGSSSNAPGKLVKSKLNFNNVVIVLAGLLVSSTTFKHMAIDSTRTNSAAVEQPTVEIAPNIHFYSQLKQYENTGTSIKLAYYFNGSDLDGKPSYYENDLMPSGWRIIGNTNNAQWQVYQVSNGYLNALIKVNYEIGGKTFSNKRDFKIARLTMAAQNINQTKLNWMFVPCEIESCAEELQNF